jgi:hypothetical protein
MKNLDLLYEYLRTGQVTVTFTKKDGTERVMRCTQDPNQIPNDGSILFTGSNHPEYNDQCRVYDLDLGEWRSFKPSKLISFTCP